MAAERSDSCGPEAAGGATAVSSNEAEDTEDLRFWELHRLGPYFVVQSQDVLVNKWALRGGGERKVH